jgi:hypothetical protein
MPTQLRFQKSGNLYTCLVEHDNPNIPRVIFSIDFGHEVYFQLSSSGKLGEQDFVEYYDVMTSAIRFRNELVQELFLLPTRAEFDNHWQKLTTDNERFNRLMNQVKAERENDEDTDSDEY